MSDFGPANAVGGVWECPDLFPLAVDGDPAKTKWVLVVNLNPGGIQGGSARAVLRRRLRRHALHRRQRRRSVHAARRSALPGLRRRDVRRLDGDRQRVRRRTRAGQRAAAGRRRRLPRQRAGEQLPRRGPRHRHADLARVHDQHAATSTSSSAAASTPTTRPPSTPRRPPAPCLADFEGDTYGAGWTATGTFAGTRPPAGTIGDQNAVSGYEGRQLVNTFIDHDNGTGHITSPEFTITKDYINFLVGGGNHPYPGTADQPADVGQPGRRRRRRAHQDRPRRRGAAVDQLGRRRS